MKYLSFVFAFAIMFLLAACSDEDSWSAADTCPADGYNVYGMPNRGTFVDERDGQEYSYMTIGNQVWMEDNLNIQSSRSLCYEYKEENCALYGRLYALQYGTVKKGVRDSLFGFLNYDMVDTICPTGWHVPTMSEYETLLANMEGVGNVKKDKCLSVTKYGDTGIGYDSENAESYGGVAFYTNGRSWWSQTMASGMGWAFYFDLCCDGGGYSRTSQKGYFFIRCIKD